MLTHTDTMPPRLSEDSIALIIGGTILTICLAAVLLTVAPEQGIVSPLKPYLTKPGKWVESPLEGLKGIEVGLLGVAVLVGVLFTGGVKLAGGDAGSFARAYLGLFLLATLAFVLAQQKVVSYYGLGYALWAIVLGLAISNTLGTPSWLRDALRVELFMKVGLVLLGAEVLLSKLVALGLPGVCISWIVTPIVLISTFWFGQRVLRISSPSLNMVIAADMSVCGVSAAIATAAACRAKKEELSLAVGMSMAFTVVMMIVLPIVARLLDLGPVIGGAWLGGTIDSTGAVGAAGALLGSETDDTAVVVATTVKMIQNILIGVMAFGVATYWVTVVEPGQQESDANSDASLPRPGLIEIWQRLPKFIFGFLGASILFSLIYNFYPQGEEIFTAVIKGSTKTLRGWCFCLAFVGIGLQSDFRVLRKSLDGGKPLVLYVCGQSLNLVLTLLMSYLMFEWVFPDVAAQFIQP
ncbi:MAG: putative sulfate exporter family transporter [Planctomycetes bacterium]|nr:putative sulfate exporter family transporter [Planctomycetota bacterium]